MNDQTKPLSFRTKFVFGFGDLGNAAAATVIPLLFLFFLTDVAGISPGKAGTILLICKIWDALVDPYIGVISDNSRHPMGRRRPFFLFASVPFAVLFGLLWTIPSAFAARPGTYIAMVYIAYTTAASFIQIPYNSLTAQLTTHYHERTALTSYRMAFSIGAGILFSVIPIEIVHAFEDQRQGFSIMGWSVAAILIASPLALFYFIKERPREMGEEAIDWRRGIRIIMANKPFWLALIMFLFSWMALDVLAAMLVYYIKYWLQKESWISLYLGTVFVTAAIFLPGWLALSRRIGKKASYLMGSTLLTLCLLVLYLLPGTAHLPALLLCFLVGIGVSAIHVFPWSIIPDVVEYDELKSGKRREGLYSGFASLLRQLSTSGALFLVGMLLEQAGYQPNAAQTPEALRMIRLLIGPVAAIMYLISMAAIWFYPIDQVFHDRMNNLLARKRTRHAPETD